MSYVFVLDTHHIPQTPVHPAVARKLLCDGQAAVFRRYPFTIILSVTGPGPLFALPRDRVGGGSEATFPCRLKIDPGAKTTGLALLQGERVLWAAELTHRGPRIKARLEARRAVRRSRRQRHTRYRQPRFLHRRRPEGWLPPSLRHRVQTTLTWVERLCRYAPVQALSVETVRFDTQLLQDAEVSGVGYQHGELAGYEVREYLLEKWSRTCVYCQATNVPLEVEHIVPRSRGGSDRVSNLTLACQPCNQRKGNRTADEFGYPTVQAQAKHPLKDAAAVNATRWALYRALCTTGLPVEVGTGGRTKYNRTRLKLPKTHWLDAACVGSSTPVRLQVAGTVPLLIAAMGHGNRQQCGTDPYGFPSRHRSRRKQHYGFQTGDIVLAVVAKGKATGIHTGRVTVRTRPTFKLNGQEVHAKYCRLLQRAEGYLYTNEKEKDDATATD